MAVKKPHFAISGLQSLPAVGIPEDLRRNIEKLIKEHPEVDVRKCMARIEALKDFWSDEGIACLRRQRKHLYKDQKAMPKKVAPQYLATEQGPIQYRMEDAVSYVAERMPASYAAHYRVFSEIKRRIPNFRPSNIMDFGSGPGTSMWAIRELWPECLQRATMIETSHAMVSVCAKLMEGVVTLPLVQTLPLVPNVGKKPPREARKNDLVICAFSMNELPAHPHRSAIIKYLWSLTRDMLVIIEPATLAGSALVQRLRHRVITSDNARVRSQYKGLYMPMLRSGIGVHVVAPCAHEGACPLSRMEEGGICALKQAVQVKDLQDKEGKTPEEAFSFVVLRKGFRPSTTGWRPKEELKKRPAEQGLDATDLTGSWLRIMRTPQKLGNGVTIPVCMPFGTKSQARAGIRDIKVVQSDDPELYEVACQAKWGDVWPR